VPGFKKEIFSMDRYKQFEISCFNGTGLEGILNALETSLQSHTVGENVLVTHQRHFLELEKSKECLERLQSLIRSGVSHELWAEELREALLALGRIRGKNLSSAAFEEIFSKFCIGK
jgi:tRNA U34 5-carboxymethylaminomethyl modifying GTPase MnmE/TrmE